MRILFVCIGNICRSPIAEGVLKHLTEKNGLNWQIDSAGTKNYHIGSAPHKSSQKICQTNFIDISKQKAKQFQVSDLNKYDLIYAMAVDVYEEIKELCAEKFDENKVVLFLDELYPHQNRSVVDPWYGDEAGYAPVYDEIEQTCRLILKKYNS